MWEWANIRWLTNKQNWTATERRMMGKAGRLHALRWGAALVFMLVVGVAVQQFVSYQQAYVARREQENDRKRAESLVDAVLAAPPDAVPYAIEKLGPLREHALPMLHSRFEQSDTEASQRLRAACALAAFGRVECKFLAAAVRKAPSRECGNIISALALAKDAAAGALRKQAGPAGSFTRKDDQHGNDPDAIEQRVTLTRPFLLSDREVSVGQFQQFVDDPDCPDKDKPANWEGADKDVSPSDAHPVQQVTWCDAVLFCNWLSRKEGLRPCYERTGEKETIFGDEIDAWRVVAGANGYRLPTEAEWE